jgi:hypothetical protein
MVETFASKHSAEMETGDIEELELKILFSKLFIDRKVEFFDAEPDEEFINVFDHVDSCPIEERRKALEEFRRELRLEESFAGEYGGISEILVQSEDFADNMGVPFLMFNLTCDEDRNDPAYSFRLDFFEVFYVGDDRFLVVLYVRNVRNGHMEMYMRFRRDEATGVVKALLRVFEDYMGYAEDESPSCFVTESGLEEILAAGISGIDTPQLRDAREATEAKFREFHFGN